MTKEQRIMQMDKLAESIRVKLEIEVSERSEFPGTQRTQQNFEITLPEQINTLTDLVSTR